jgi:hypothetical protein
MHPDAFWTPHDLGLALVEREALPGRIWEPACGRGWLAEVLRLAGNEVYATDLYDYGYTRQADLLDFLAAPAERGCGSIVTNPPYGGGVLRHWLRSTCRHHRPQVAALLLPLVGSLQDVMDPTLVGEMRLKAVIVPACRPVFVHADGRPPYQPRWSVAWFVLVRSTVTSTTAGP